MNYIREWRLSKGLTLTEVAKRAKVTKGEISRLERGERKISMDWLDAFSRILGEPVSHLLRHPNTHLVEAQRAEKAGKSIAGVGLSVTTEGHDLLLIESDEMQPTLMRGDVVLYDTGRTSPAPAGLFVVRIDGELVARRLHGSGKSIRVMCDNPAYRSVEDDVEIVVVGRILGRFHTL